MRKIAFLLLLPMLASCASTVNLDAAENSNDAACAEVSVRYPKEIGDLKERYTNAQATAAWGEPVAVIARCGLEPVEISTLSCVTSSDVDWLVDDSQAPSYRFISFATTPAVEVIVDSQVISGVSALDAMANAVKQLPITKRCSAVGN